MIISDIDSECLRFLMSSKVSGEELWADIFFKLDYAEVKNLRYMRKQCPPGSQLYTCAKGHSLKIIQALNLFKKHK